jgi:hypothetical protein
LIEGSYPITTTALTIVSTAIRQEVEVRYCLNDLHKATREAAKNQPNLFIAGKDTDGPSSS